MHEWRRERCLLHSCPFMAVGRQFWGEACGVYRYMCMGEAHQILWSCMIYVLLGVPIWCEMWTCSVVIWIGGHSWSKEPLACSQKSCHHNWCTHTHLDLHSGLSWQHVWYDWVNICTCMVWFRISWARAAVCSQRFVLWTSVISFYYGQLVV